MRGDVRSAESIIGSLEAKVIDLKERMHTCMTTGDKTLVVVKVLERPASLGVYFYYRMVHTH